MPYTCGRHSPVPLFMDSSLGRVLEHLHHTGDGMLAVDTDFRILACNDAAAGLLGVDATDAVGKHCYEVLHGVEGGGDPVCHDGCMPMSISAGGGVLRAFDCHVGTQSTESESEWVNMSTIAVPDAAGGLGALVHLMRARPTPAHSPGISGTSSASGAGVSGMSSTSSTRGKESFVERRMVRHTGRTGRRLPVLPDSRLSGNFVSSVPAASVPASPTPAIRLTRREREVLNLLCDGAGTEELAAHLCVTPKTASNYVYRLLRKLGVHSRVEAVARTRRVNLA